MGWVQLSLCHWFHHCRVLRWGPHTCPPLPSPPSLCHTVLTLRLSLLWQCAHSCLEREILPWPRGVSFPVGNLQLPAGWSRNGDGRCFLWRWLHGGHRALGLQVLYKGCGSRMELPGPSTGCCWAPGQAEQDKPIAGVVEREHQALHMGGVDKQRWKPTQPPILRI